MIAGFLPHGTRKAILYAYVPNVLQAEYWAAAHEISETLAGLTLERCLRAIDTDQQETPDA